MTKKGVLLSEIYKFSILLTLSVKLVLLFSEIL